MQHFVDIWFGPGGLTGVFGAGVADGLHQARVAGNFDLSRVRLFGSSVGCLTATYLATNNTDHGIEIYLQDLQGLIRAGNLLPSLGARLANFLATTLWDVERPLTVPDVLHIEHAMQIMLRRTPQIVDELNETPIPVFVERVSTQTGEIGHVEVRKAHEPLSVIRDALCCFPFAYRHQADYLDSGISGYGFERLLTAGERPLIIVLNAPPSAAWRSSLEAIGSAALAICPRVSRLYLARRRNRRVALQSASRANDRVLLVTPAAPVRVKAEHDFRQAFAEGQQAAQRIVRFMDGCSESKVG